MAAGMFIGRQMNGSGLRPPLFLSGKAQTEARALQEVIQYISWLYVDEVNTDSLNKGAIERLLAGLDPHSAYLPPGSRELFEEEMEGGFVGIGIEFILINDTIHVVTPIHGGPAERAGILSGDRIIRIADSLVAGVQMDWVAIARMLRKQRGEKVGISLLRRGERQLRHFQVVCEHIPLKSVETAYALDAGTIYVKINKFAAQTGSEFIGALHDLIPQGQPANLILDLRGNPGGLVESAITVLNQLFVGGKLLLYTKSRNGEKREYKSNGRAHARINNVVVLVDEGSASASEIVAGAVQDHDRGWIVGRRTFGKGLVQEQYPLANGGALRLTVARYYTPSGRCIQRDYRDRVAYEAEAAYRRMNGGLSERPPVALPDSAVFYTGLGREVYAGGGIYPDAVIPIDTVRFNDFYYEARQYAPQYAEIFKANLPDPRSSQKSLTVNDVQLADFLSYLRSEGVDFEDSEYRDCKEELRRLLLALAYRTASDQTAYYRTLNEADPVMLKALDLIKRGPPTGDE